MTYPKTAKANCPNIVLLRAKTDEGNRQASKTNDNIKRQNSIASIDRPVAVICSPIIGRLPYKTAERTARIIPFTFVVISTPNLLLQTI